MKPILAYPSALAVFTALLVVGCSGGDDGEGDLPSVAITREIGQIAPQFGAGDAGARTREPTLARPLAPGDTRAVSYEDTLVGSLEFIVTEFLRFTCHSADGTFNVCDSYGIEVDGGFATSPYVGGSENFTSTLSAFGSQFDEVFGHPEEVPGCLRFDGTAKVPAFTGSTEFLLGAGGGFLDSLGCVASTRYGTSAVDVYFAYSESLTRATFITTGIGDPGRGSYIYQGYARRDDQGRSHVIAMNSPVVNLNGSRQRVVFIGNLDTHRIVMKWSAFGNGTYKGVYVLGVSGRTGGGVVPGYYGLRVESEEASAGMTTATVCVDNGARAIVPAADAPTRCADPIIGAWLEQTSTWNAVATYLGLTAADLEILDEDWAALLETGSALTTGQVPSMDADLVTSIE